MADDSTPKNSAQDLSVNADEFADVYKVDTERATIEAKLQRWYDAMEAEPAS